MTIRRGITIGLLFALLSSIGSALLMYQSMQQHLTLEGNHLYSTQSIRIEGNLLSLRGEWPASRDNLVVYKTIDDNAMIRGIYSANYSQIDFPVHRGRTFNQGDSSSALVGSKVEVVERGDKSYYSLDGQDYEVVGYLGRQEESLLENDVLLADDRLFTETGDETLVLDGPNIASNYAALFPHSTFETMNQSTNRRTTIDFVSPVLMGLGLGIIALGSIFIGLLAASYVQVRNKVWVLMGRTSLYTTGHSVLQIVVPALIAIIATAIIWSSISANEIHLAPAILMFWWQLPLSVLAMLTALAVASRRS